MFRLPELPYAYGSLAPTLSEATMHLHHDKHHAKYVETTNTLLKDDDSGATLESVIRSAKDRDQKLFNNAAQAWNHGFFWACMRPSPTSPSAPLARAIDASFGGQDALKKRFVKEGTDHFGSGWAWIVAHGPDLTLVCTHDAATPIVEDGAIPILTCDLWEHAYYLDHKNDRAAFLGAWWDKLANWALADSQFAAASAAGSAWRYPAPVSQTVTSDQR